MKDVYEMYVRENSGEEMLEGMTADFPYTGTRALLDRYRVLWHWHKAVEMFYMESGGLEYETPQGKWSFPPGSGGFVNTGILHRTRPLDGVVPTVQNLHIFDAAFLYGDAGSRIFRKYYAPVLASPGIEMIPLYPDNEEHRRVLDRLKASFLLSEQERGYELRLREVLSGIWLDMAGLGQIKSDGGTVPIPSDKVKLMMLYIHNHYQEPVKIAQIAASGFVSERECYRAFWASLHTTPGEYLRNYRLQTACRMLQETRESITYISQACGFGSSSFFGKTFLSRFGMTPTAYRNFPKASCIWQDSTN